MDLNAALACLRDAPEIWCLAGPWSLLTWDVEPAGLGDLPPPYEGVEGEPDGAGWSGFAALPLFLVQADYDGAPQVVRVRSALVWDPSGACHELGAPRLSDPAARSPEAPRLLGPLVPAWDGEAHAAGVARLGAHIAAGDCYQVNLTVPFRGTLAAGDDLDVALALLTRSPAPFAALIRRPGRPTVVSHSPECFLATAGDRVLACPIKGTRRRGLRAELLAADKDRAELTMIVDLMRNDLGRVARTGSVRVPAPARVLDLPYVHHLVADVAARLRPGTTWAALLAATSPAGSITGAPKDMARRLIARYEYGPRGPYCGSFGWVGPRAGQLAVAIRTLTVDGRQVTLHAGSGIVADSQGAEEWDEVRAKASAMAEALGGAV